MTKKIVCLLLVIAALLPSLCAQSRLLRTEKNQKGAAVSFNGVYSTIKSAASHSFLYYTPSYAADGKRVVYTYDTATGQNDSLVVVTGRKGREFLTERIESFSVIGNKCVFVCSYHLFVLEIRDKSLRFTAKMENVHAFTKSFVLGEKIFLYTCYNFHPDDVANKHVWATLNLSTNTLDKVTIQPDDNALFGSFLNSWIAYARSAEYTITIHNEAFEQIDSIKIPELDANKPHVDRIKERELYSKDAVSNLRRVDDSLFTRIRKVYFLNDTTLLALIKLPNRNQLRADYWRKSNGAWTRFLQDSSALWFEEGQAYSGDRLTYTDFYQNMFDFVNVGHNRFCLIYFPYIPTVSTTKFNKDEDYFRLQNEAVKSNDLFFGIKDIRIAVPDR